MVGRNVLCRGSFDYLILQDSVGLRVSDGGVLLVTDLL